MEEELDAAAPVLTAPPGRVPKFDEFSESSGMNRLQKSFYQRVFLPSLLAGNPVDVQGRPGYAEVLLFELRQQHLTAPAEARRTLESYIAAYPGRYLHWNAHKTLAEFSFLEGSFDAGYLALGSRVDPSLHLTLSPYLGHPALTAEQVFAWSEWAITRKGFDHLDALLGALQARLDRFHAEHGTSLVFSFWQRLTADDPVDAVARSVENDVASRMSRELVRALVTEAREKVLLQEPGSRPKPDGVEDPVHWPDPWVDWYDHGPLLFALFKTLVRDAENVARDQTEVPRVGEGWVSEMTLLRQVQAAFPDEQVHHRARPYWLKPQSLDIYLPARNIAVEYQGAQHTRPIEHFGGAQAFDRQQERDARKAAACDDYGCTLIDVHPGYLLEEVVARIRAAINARPKFFPDQM